MTTYLRTRRSRKAELAAAEAERLAAIAAETNRHLSWGVAA